MSRTGALALAAALAVAACDLGGPGGPASVRGTVTGDAALGAAVVEIGWGGVTGFEGRGSTQAYSGVVSGIANRYRIVLVDATGGDLQFAIDLEDANLYAPAMTIVSAVDTNNQALALGNLRIVLER